jgi:hypothetical protein
LPKKESDTGKLVEEMVSNFNSPDRKSNWQPPTVENTFVKIPELTVKLRHPLGPQKLEKDALLG